MTDVKLSQMFQTWAAWSDQHLTDTDKVDAVLENSSTLPAKLKEIKDSVDQGVTAEQVQQMLDDMSSSLLQSVTNVITNQVVNQVAAVNTQVGALNTATSSLNDTVADVKETLQTQIADINSDIQKSITSLAESTAQFEENLGKALDNVNTQLSATMKTVQSDLEKAVNSSFNDMQTALVTIQGNLDKSITDVESQLSIAVEGTKSDLSSSLKSTRSALSEALNDVDTECSSIVSRLKTMVSDIEASTTIRDIQTKVSAYYTTYGQLTAQLTDLLSQVAVTYRDWVTKASEVSAQKLELADELEAVETRLKKLEDHEQKLDDLNAQFSHLITISNQIAVLNAHWESDHATIEKFNAIVASQKTYDNSMLAANVGTALTGIADAVTAAKAVTQKSSNAF